MSGAAENRGITFDELFRIRVLDPDKYNQTESLKEECSAFTEKITSLSSLTKTLVDAVDAQAARIETEKLRAVGKRNQASAEAEVRKRKKKEAQALIAEKQEELERMNVQYESLMKVKHEQELLIAKLSDSSM
mmetsp:Transcript_9309/g.10763  ORF Transcript_9309/g.10763 Transcript_9309/m.10763 type:complete len:133 (-) Transcript_9309:310-708(-)|eukprot:CAMPEP_0197847200 /NCGR_PEP_ID=MMETSP1438-20131217/5496_1 /TAXON_ID=1461541 /ORGANISM="Pterosperma sp., Strain CCMP1384" /LENGTH=132 /DNA_ID=CAMNT_0043459061 /DNA_START=236 /DNA_END=634 /DNA_ORIENTATION=+